MCGRFAQKSSAKKIAKQFKVEEVPPLVERYNVAPTQSVLAGREPDARHYAFGRPGEDEGILRNSDPGTRRLK